MPRAHFTICVALLAAAMFAGCRNDQVAQNGTSNTSNQASNHVANMTLPSGTSLDVTLSTPITSETAGVGDAWTGTIRNASMVDGHNAFPAGSSVAGTVTSVKPAHKGDRAMLDLGLTSVTVGDHSYRVHGTMESITAGSTRARNLGAIGAATAAGAVVGHAIGGSGKGTLIGAVVGGGAATGVVAGTKGYQVELKQGTALTFTTNEAVAVRL
jgi:hypothetical protein